MAQSSQPVGREDFEIAIICALQSEADAVEALFDKFWDDSGEKYGKAPGDSNAYTTGVIGPHNVVLAHLPGMGKGSTASVASSFRFSFPGIKLALVVGVCGGVPKGTDGEDILLGDVVISDGLVAYDFGRQYSDKFVIKDTLQDSLGRPNMEIRSLLAKLKGFRSRKRMADQISDYLKDIQRTLGVIKARYPGRDTDKLFESTYRHKHHDSHSCAICAKCEKKDDEVCPTALNSSCLELKCNENNLVSRSRLSTEPLIHYGSIASGDKVMKAGEDRDAIALKENVIAFEMEGAGVWDIFPSVIIKGVCDYADSHKNKGWQNYAAATAAGCMKAFLKEWIQTDKVSQSKVLTVNLNDEHKDQRKLEEEKKLDEQKKLEEQERLEDCLRSLSFSNVDDRLYNISFAHTDTCNWLFNTTQFQQWRNRVDLATHNGVLWIKGKPGAGKSTLMKHTLLYFQETLEDYVIAAYFFNARGTSLEKTPLGMLRSIIYQLFDQDLLLRKRFMRLFLEKRKKHGLEWEWQLGELKDFLLSEIKKFAVQRKPLLLFIDALDECNEPEVRNVVSFIELLSATAVSTKTVLNICLSSRHYPTISMEKRLELRIDEESGHDQDILLYVQHKLRVRDEEIERQLLRKAAHVFMWVVLVIEMLNQASDDGDVRAMKKKLDEVPSDLDEVFSNLLNKNNPNKERTLLVLQWVLFANRLLTLEELYFAVMAGTEMGELGAWDLIEDSPNMIERFITSSSKGLIEVTNRYTRTVQFIHESVNDFLLRNKRLQTLDRSLELHTVGASHDQLVACCMSYIKMKELEPWTTDLYSDNKMVPELNTAERNHLVETSDVLSEYWFENEWQGMDKDARFKRVLKLKFPFLDYASTQILYHAEKAQADCVTQQALIWRLQQPHGEFDLLRNFHNIVQESKWLSYGAEGDLLNVALLEHYYELVKAIVLARKTRVNSQGGGGLFGTTLQAASYAGTSAVVQELLEKEPNINEQGGYYGNALQTASSTGNDVIVQQLLEKGADVNAQGGYYGTALQAASHMGKSAIVQVLLENGANVNALGGCYGTALQAASHGGSSAVVQLLLEKGADVNAQGGCYGTALQAASHEGNSTVIKLLLEKGAKVNAHGGQYGTALQAASKRGSTLVVQQLLDNGADVDAQGGKYNSALQAASHSGHESIVHMLLEKGADVNALGGIYGTALEAASCEGETAIVQQLLENGANVNAWCGSYSTALHAASFEGNSAVVQLLLENGADVNAQDTQKSTPLHSGSFRGSSTVVQLLLEKGADVNALGGKYNTPLQAASFGGSATPIQAASDGGTSAVVHLLLKNGAEINAQGGLYGNALQAASFRGRIEVVLQLLENGANINAQGGPYGTALQAACHMGIIKIVQLLLEKTANVNMQGGLHGTALQAASCQGDSKIVTLLLEKGADVNARGGQHGSPLQAALKEGHDAIAQQLREAGAVQLPREERRPRNHFKTTIRLRKDRRVP